MAQKLANFNEFCKIEALMDFGFLKPRFLKLPSKAHARSDYS